MRTAYDVHGADWVRRVSDAGVVRVCGQLAYERGLGYLDAERVETVSTGDQGRLLLASVDGSRSRPYSTMITALGSDTEGEPAWTGRCSCPVQQACKHVAAVLLTVRDHLDTGEAAPTCGWRDQLQDAMATAKRSSGPRAGDLVTFPYAIAVSTFRAPGGFDVELRPTRMTARGSWHKSLGWADLAAEVRGGAPSHVQSLAAFQRVVTPHPWAPSPAVLLSEVSEQGWLLLRRLVADGVELIPEPAGAQGLTEIELLADPVELSLEVSDNDGALTIHAAVEGLAGDARPMLLGSPPRGAAARQGDRLVLGELAGVVDPVRAALLGASAITVPPDEVDQFRTYYLPALEAAAPVRLRAADGTVTVRRPDTHTPVRLRIRVRAGSAREGGATPVGATGSDPADATAAAPAEEELGTGEISLELALAYGARIVPVGLDQASPGRRRQEERALVERLDERLRELGLLEPIGGLGWWPVERARLRGMDAVHFTRALDDLAVLDDVVIELVDELPTYEEVSAEPVIEVGTREAADASATDWFDLHVAVTIDGEEVPFEPLFQALARGDTHLVLASGSYFSLDHPGLHRLREVIAEARELEDRPGRSTRINRFQVGLWDELVALGVVTEQARAWTESAERLRTLASLPAPPVPDGLHAQLRPYQHDGYAWLSTLWDVGLGGVLADDMGLGKTVQVLAMLERARADGELTEPVLVVAPTSMLGTWVSEAAKFTPELSVVSVAETTGKRGSPLPAAVRGAQVVVTTYAVLRLDADAFHGLGWRGLVLDEAQAIKNHQSKTYQAVRTVRAPFRLAMSGTPLENSLMDLWSLLSVAAPGLYPRPDEFTRVYRKPIESGAAPERLDRLRRRIRPLMLRRTKDEVAADLPEKQVQVSNVPLTPVHARLYEQHLQRERQRVLGLLDDPESNRVAILAALTRLRQLALDPALIDPTHAAGPPSAKLAALVEHVRELAAEGHRALVFSQFTRYLQLAQQALERAGLDTCYLDGSMSAAARARAVESFRGGTAPAFLISLKAGGTGLTLTEADYVFVLDPWWNPATEAQAIDRTHRIGQSKPVMVYRLVSQGTIEDKVVALQERKRELFERVLGDGGALSGPISADDVRDLLDL